MRYTILLLIFLCFTFCHSIGYAQECPRIFQSGDTLYTDPANAYQWYKDGEVVPGAIDMYYVPEEGGIFSVWVEKGSQSFNISESTIALHGDVFDDKLQPIQGATCTCQNKSVVTSSKGEFMLSGIEFDERLVVNCSKEKYLDKTYGFKPTGFTKQHVKLKMQPREVTEVINAQEGGFIRNHLGMVHLQPNSIANENGDLYEGDVHVHFKHYSPDDEWYGLSMPGGDFMALDQNDDEVILYSYGVLEAELTTPTGDPLNIADGHTAKLYYVIVPEQWDSAPDSIPLWYFDEKEKYWLQEGWAIRESNTYVTEVSHFSAWNCDWQGPRAIIRGTVNGGCENEPIGGVPVHLSNMTVYTDENGRFESWCAATIPFNVTIGDTTFPVSELNEGEVYEIPDIMDNVEPIVAYSIISVENELTTYVHGGVPPYYFSFDDGLSYQNDNSFTVLQSDIPCVLVQDSCGGIYRSCQVYDLYYQNCYIISDDESYFDVDSIMGAIAQRKTVYDINLSYKDLNDFPTELILMTPCLKKLACNKNKIENIPSEIGQLSELENINISYNQLDSIPKEIGNLINLTYLDCSNNQLVNLPEKLFNLTNLTHLYCNYNQLNILPKEIENLSSLTSLSIYSNLLKSIPIEISKLSSLTSLSIYNNKLESLPKEIGNLSSLTYLNCSENKIASLPKEIKNLSNLTNLNCSYNQLTSLPIEVGELVNLTDLDCSSNQLISLPNGLDKLTNLTSLVCSSNLITSLPIEIEELVKLTDLDCSSNQLISLPNGVGKLTNLTSLKCHNNKLVSLPIEIGELVNLKNLSLNNNQLTSLPNEIGNLTNLTKFHCYSNQLESLPNEIGNLTNLTEFHCYSNQLVNLPNEIGNLSNLSELHCFSNQLTNLPNEIGNFTNLTHLYCTDNQLVSLPNEIGQLSNLIELDCSINQLNSIPKEIGQLSSLLKLNCPNNKLTSLPNEIGNLSSLTIFICHNNEIKELPIEIGQLSNLTKLSCYSNLIENLPSEIGQLMSLEYFDCRFNNLKSLPPEIANLKENLKDLLLDGNNFSQEEKDKVESWLPNTTIYW